jgi:colanic acid biosynthesis protein WcaH
MECKKEYKKEIEKSINTLESCIENPSEGLPEELFLFTSRITPLINVDLLIKNEHGHTILTWRDDRFYSPGWHIPGGIVRYKETFADRIRAVAKNELGAEVEFDPTPLAINEIIQDKRKTRGHFISLLYQCKLATRLDESLRCKSDPPNPNEWLWHSSCPENMISVHEIYRKYI